MPRFISLVSLLVRTGQFSPNVRLNRLLLVSTTFLIFLPGAQAGAGEDFSNNLFSDLAPILALFGEQVAKQFLSHSTSWLDCLIFACNPISIITGATSAIRVGGSRWLKSVIGRAGEAEAAAELELMSSTSPDVCELWNGVSVVRVVGSPAILELIYCSDGSGSTGGGNDCDEVYTLDEAKKAGLFTLKGGSQMSGQVSPPGTQASETSSRQVENQDHSPPNIFRNTSAAPENSWELMVVAVIGVILQVGVLVYDGVITYDSRWKKLRNSTPVAGYAFPLTFVGTLAVVIGMFICALVIDVRTDEERWQATSRVGKKDFFQVVWLQRGQLVGDQAFGSFAIYAPRSLPAITTSRKARGGLARLQFWSLWGSVAAIVGFVLQFVGLRNMHWSASIVQLIATGIMTLLRVLVRRHLSALPIVDQLPEGFELDFMAKAITHCSDWRILTTSSARHSSDQAAILEASAFSSRVLHTRMRLSELTLWRTECSEVADQVTQTMQALMNHLFEAEGEISITKAASQASEFVWTMPVAISRGFGEEIGEMSLKMHRTSTENRWAPWEADRAELEALISLWMSHFHQQGFDSNLWILGPYDIFSASSYDWWIYRGANSIRVQNLRSVCEANQVSGSRVLCLDSKTLPGLDASTNQIYPSNEGLLGVITKTSLQQMFGQYLLGVFLSHVTDIIDSLEGKTDVVPGVGGGSYTLVNESVRKIAETVQRYGLATVEDSYRLVVSPLCHRNKLTDPFDDRDVLRKIILMQHENSDTTSDQQAVAYRQLVDFCTKKSALLSEKDYWGAAREAFVQLISVSMEILGAYHSCTVEATRAMKEFASAFVDANSDESSIEGSDSSDGAFRLHSAAAKGDLKLAHKLLEGGMGVDTWNAESRTSLYLAIKNGHPNVCRLLIFYGANIDDATSIEEVGNNHGPRQEEVTRMLLLNWGGVSLLHKAAAKGYEIVLRTLLAENGVCVSSKDKSGWTALHYASKFGRQTTITLLIENGADLTAKCPDGQTALHLVTRNGHQTAIKLLAEAGVSINAHDNSGRTALHTAAFYGLSTIVEELVDSGGDLTSEDNDKRTALHLAVTNKHGVVVRQLIEREANLAAKDKNGLTPLHSFCVSNSQDTGIIELLLEKGADMNAKDIWGGTPLETAAENGNVLALKLLMSKGADLKCRNNSGRTALETATSKGHTKVIELLIKDGVDVGNKDGFERTALHYATMEGYNAITNLLLVKGFDVDATDVDGWTPLHYASRNRHKGTVNILLERGADTSIKDRKGKVASYYSTQRMGNAVSWLRALGG